MTEAKKETAAKGDVQEQSDAEEAKGYHGVKVDPTPNDHYTVAGVLAGKPTPETDPEHKAAVQAELRSR